MLASTASRASTVVGVTASGGSLAQAFITLVRRGTSSHRRQQQQQQLGLRGAPPCCCALSREKHDTSSNNNSTASNNKNTTSSSPHQKQNQQRRPMGSLGAASPAGAQTTLAGPEAAADGATASSFSTTAAASAAAAAAGDRGTNGLPPSTEPSTSAAAAAAAAAAAQGAAGAGAGAAAAGAGVRAGAAVAVAAHAPPPLAPVACHLPQPTTGPLSSPAVAVAAPSSPPSCVLHNAFLDPRCDPTQHGSPDACPPFTLLLLNYALPPLTLDLWDRAAYRVCADGGANRLAELVERCVGDAGERQRYLPDYITGDLDSLRPTVRAMYERAGIEVVEVADQDTTDLQKSLNHIQARLKAQQLQPPGKRHTVAVMGALGGRLDHTVANLATLGRYPDLHVVLLGDGNSAQLVLPGRSIIRPVEGVEGPTCGLVPLFNGARVSSKGLRWDLSDDAMHMTGLVSTSNLLAAPQVEVHTDQPLVWTIELPH